MNEEPGRGHGTTKHRAVLAIACIVEGGVGVGVSATLLNLFIMTLQAWENNGFWGKAEPFSTPLPHIAAFAILPVVAVLAGTAPSWVRVNSSGESMALSLSVVLCLGACIVWVLLFVVGLSVESLPNLVRLILLPAIPFILIPLLVDRWT
jgi:hypothetical protein